MPEPNTGCWLWLGYDNTVYGAISVASDGVGGHRMALAHRLSYELHVGPIPEGLEILHSCDTPLCINPDHLQPGTHRENVLDCVRKGRAKGGYQSRLPRSARNAIAYLGAMGHSSRQMAVAFGVSRSRIGEITGPAIGRRRGVVERLVPEPPRRQLGGKGTS
jgi:hypothetical protein